MFDKPETMSDVKTALRTLRVFELFSVRREPLVLSELAEQLEIPASSCLLLVRTLLQHGYLYEVSRRNGYYPTRRLLEFMVRIATSDPVVAHVRPILAHVQEQTGESVTLSKLHGQQLIYLDVVDSNHVMRPALAVGMLRPLHGAASGKALLSQLTPQARLQLLRETGMAKLTPNTLRSHRVLDTQIAAGAERGWFSSVGESEPELSAVAVPVQLAADPYAVTVLGTSRRMDDKLERYAKVLLAAKADIERRAEPDAP